MIETFNSPLKNSDMVTVDAAARILRLKVNGAEGNAHFTPRGPVT
jgi:hypothetical protein